ncbi:hypothetical protein [Methylocapsa aurea]|uniref:hypothetical protein n=1 Tax=Methylocapsa aurea TaxID=663610 RepID=UPI00056C4E65|nr:hypothetical protein [Methylocapsa aurea]
MRALWPHAEIGFRVKSEAPHDRSLKLTLGDGRCVKFLLAQGFGAWRAEGTPRHNFRADAGDQARAIIGATYAVAAAESGIAPMIVWEQEDEGTPTSGASGPTR